MERERRVRRPAVAGRFYPAGAESLERAVRRFLADAERPVLPSPKALIVPHAGYAFSGPVAGSGFGQLSGSAGVIRRVVLLGPAHFVSINRPAISGSTAFATPLGEVPIDGAAEQIIEDLVIVDGPAHAPEHSLEVELPFLQVALQSFQVVPVLVGRVGERAAEKALDRLYGGPETLLVISTDLSHYLPQAQAQKLDTLTASQIEALDAGAVADERACGAPALRALLRVARRHNLTVTRLDLRTSADTAGPADSVVGYGSFALA